MTVSPIRLKAMREAIVDGNEQKVRLLMKAGVDVAGADETGTPYLSYAVIGRHMHLVKLLEAEGADMLTPGLLCRAIEAPAGEGPHRELALHILTNNELPQEERDWGLICASGSGDMELAKALIERGANVNYASDVTFVFPLWAAVANGDIQMVRLLLAHGGDPRKNRIRDYDDKGRTITVGTLAEMADVSGHKEIAGLLSAA
jgi:ankyrin repeat protein